MKHHLIPLTFVYQQVKPLEQYIVMRRKDDLLAVAGQLQKYLHQIFHQLGIEIGFGLVPQQRAGGAWVKAAVAQQALQHANLAKALGGHAAGQASFAAGHEFPFSAVLVHLRVLGFAACGGVLLYVVARLEDEATFVQQVLPTNQVGQARHDAGKFRIELDFGIQVIGAFFCELLSQIQVAVGFRMIAYRFREQVWVG